MNTSRADKALLLFSLYFAQGLPFGFFSLALPVILREAGVSLVAIGTLGLLTLPWVLKFLWAPLLDAGGSRRRRLLGLQLAAVAGALALMAGGPESGFALLFVAAFTFNLVAASQDVLTDGLAVRMLDARERGLGNGLQVGAYRVGMILGGGLLLWLYARGGWRVVFLTMALLLAVTVLPVLRLRDPPRERGLPAAQARSLVFAWFARMRQPTILATIAIIVGYRFGDQLVTAMLGPFLKDAGLALETIALMKGAVGSATSLVGAVVGGVFVFAVGRRRALLVSGLAQAACFLLYIAAARGQGGVTLLWVATVAEGVIGTVATVALFTLMMDAADPEHAGTDYTLLASVVVLVGMVAGLVAGLVAELFGYTTTFVTGTVLAVAGCLGVIGWLDRKAPAQLAAVWR